VAVSAGWVKVDEINGGQVVLCRLCGKRFTRTFWVEDTNYAEALRLATAYAWKHEHSEEHSAALAAFHGEQPEVSSEDALLTKIFGTEPPAEMALRRRAARSAAERVKRQA
jgi:NMD protein affecting ribosome stability and mRNA decay